MRLQLSQAQEARAQLMVKMEAAQESSGRLLAHSEQQQQQSCQLKLDAARKLEATACDVRVDGERREGERQLERQREQHSHDAAVLLTLVERQQNATRDATHACEEPAALALPAGSTNASVRMLGEPALLVRALMARSPHLPRLLGGGVGKWVLTEAPPGAARPTGADEVEVAYAAWRGNESVRATRRLFCKR
eukprot:6840621-Prymnesium_polylepis.2